MQLRCCISFLILTIIVSISSCKKNKHKFIAPTTLKPGLLIPTSRACYFDIADAVQKKAEIKLELPDTNELEQIKSIMKYVGLPQNFKIYRGNISNAMATMQDNQRLIIYNKDLFAKMNALDSNYWSSLFIIAHEIGHHLAYNISDSSNSIQAELDADIFASSLLYRMGADSNQVSIAINSNLISNTEDTKTHPSKNKRLAVVKQSWYQASVLRFNSTLPPPIDDDFSPVDDETIGRGFTKENLVLNSWGKELLDYDDDEYKGTDSSMYNKIMKKNYMGFEGIILNTEKREDWYGYEKNSVSFIQIEVLVTKTNPAYVNYTKEWDGDDGYWHGYLKEHEKYQFLIAFEPASAKESKKEFYRFFSEGRRFQFDVVMLDLQQAAVPLYNISRVNAL